MISILILILCCCGVFAWIFTLISSERTVRIMPVLSVTALGLSLALLILSISYRKMLVSVILTAFFFCYLIYLLFHREAEYQPERKLLVFTSQKLGKFTCELKEIYASPEDFPQKKALHAYRTPDNFIMLRNPETETEYFAYQFTNYKYMLDGVKQNCLVIGTVNMHRLPMAEYHQKRIFAYAEHLLYTFFITFITVPMLFLSVMRQSSANLENFIKNHAETGVQAVSTSEAECYPHEDILTLVISRNQQQVNAVKLISLNLEEAQMDIITINARLMRSSTDYKTFRECLNTDDFSQIKTIFQDTFGIALNHIFVMQNDALLNLPDKKLFLSLTKEQAACIGANFQESGNYTLPEAAVILQNLETYLTSENHETKILSENELAVMQNEYLSAVLVSALRQKEVISGSQPVRTTMTAQEIKEIYDTITISSSRYQNCIRQAEHSKVLPTVNDCMRLDDSTLYTSDAVLRFLMIQALYY